MERVFSGAGLIMFGCREGREASVYTYKHGSIQFLTVESVGCCVLTADVQKIDSFSAD